MAQLAPGRESCRGPGAFRVGYSSIRAEQPVGSLLLSLYPLTGNSMNTSVQETNDPVQMAGEKAARAVSIGSPVAPRARVRTLLAVPVAASAALAVHVGASKNQALPETHSYSV